MFRRIFVLFGLVGFLLCGSVLAQEEVKAHDTVKSGIEILFFHSDHCKACQHFKNVIKPVYMEKYGDKIFFTSFDVEEEGNYEQLVALANLYSREPAYPALYVGEQLLIGNKEIKASFETIVDELLKKSSSSRPVSIPQAKKVEEMFKGFSTLAIAIAGLIDGVNPCAFTVIVFFISFLSVYGYGKREMLIIGSSYILAVFLMYIAIGLGMFKFLYAFKHFFVLMKTFYILISLMCFILGILCLLDYFKFRRTGDPTESFLQLPALLKKKIQSVIGDEFRSKENRGVIKLTVGAFGVGVMVSLLEAVCTGQVYLPVISFVLRKPGLQVKALAYLLLYNVMFILPLLLVFGLAMWGITSQQFADYYKRRYGYIRVCMVMLFFALGFLMLAN